MVYSPQPNKLPSTMTDQVKRLPEQLKHYRTQFNDIALKTVALTEGLTQEQFNWKPEADRWSIGQCIDHLNVVGYELLPHLEKAIRQGHEKGLTGTPPFRYGMLSRWFIHFNKPSSNFKIKTFKVYEPATGDTRLNKQRTMQRFGALQRELARKVEKSNGLNLRKIKAPSPVSGLLRISLGAWFEATVAHEKRHLKQARTVIAHIH